MKTSGRTFPALPRRAAFTLLELLTVIVVMSILIALTNLAIVSVGGERKLTQAGNLAVDLINQARQTAKANNTMAMLALIKSGSDSGRVLTTLAWSATTGTNGNWKQLDAWKTLPEGIVVDQTVSADFFNSPIASGTLTRAGKTVDYSSAVFLPDGRTYSSTTQPQVLYLKSANPAPSPANFYKIIVNQATGVPIVRRP